MAVIGEKKHMYCNSTVCQCVREFVYVAPFSWECTSCHHRRSD